jgi:hypothetical protein
VLGASDDFIAQGRFSFSKTIALTDDERANPWLLLHRRFADGAVPAIGDANSLAYVLHLDVGDDFVLDPDGAAPLRLRIVGSLADSVLQSELIVSDAHFVRMFPSDGGFRVFLVDTAGRQPEVLAGALESGLAEYGLDLAPTADRLARFHRVENTYLNTFQTLGGLGLVLGTLGIGVVLFRNVLERRRELALLRAVGFGEYAISLLVVAETALLVALGAAAGTASALVAVVPAILERRTVVPVGWLALLLAGVVVTGLASSVAGAMAARRFSLVSSLRTE